MTAAAAPAAPRLTGGIIVSVLLHGALIAGVRIPFIRPGTLGCRRLR